jgi:hypothetical protein
MTSNATGDADTPRFSDRSPATLAVDNVLRRLLNVRDPADSTEVARGLLQRYRAEAGALYDERKGYAVTPHPLRAALDGTTTGSTPLPGYALELAEAYDDFDRDMFSLTDSSQLKEIKPELVGWSRAIRAIADDGMAAGRSGLDPRQRDRVFAARRQLGDYARLSRYVGALTPDMNPQFRRLAQSCEVLASLMLVLVGDSMAGSGVRRSTVVLQASAADLTDRRDAAVMALRVLTGATTEAYAADKWPRGLEAYRRIISALDSSGQSDLRSLFSEQTLARALDELIDLAAGSTTDGLRALGSTALITVQRLHRLLTFAQSVMASSPLPSGRLVPESPPLAGFLSALSLFVEAFDDAGGASRLLYVARPPLIFYGLYGFGGPDMATRTLLNLIQLRGVLAEQVDCFLDCCCEEVECQLMLDRLLADVDRCVDLYCLGSDPLALGDPERRAAAYGAMTVAFQADEPQCAGPFLARFGGAENILTQIGAELRWPVVMESEAGPPGGLQQARVAQLIYSELCLQLDAEDRWARLVSALAPNCRGDLLSPARNPVRRLLNAAMTEIQAEFAALGGVGVLSCPSYSFGIPPHLETSLDTIANDILANGQ